MYVIAKSPLKEIKWVFCTFSWSLRPSLSSSERIWILKSSSSARLIKAFINCMQPLCQKHITSQFYRVLIQHNPLKSAVDQRHPGWVICQTKAHVRTYKWWNMGTHLNMYLKCNAGAPHSSKKWLKPFSVLFLCLFCNGL